MQNICLAEMAPESFLATKELLPAVKFAFEQVLPFARVCGRCSAARSKRDASFRRRKISEAESWIVHSVFLEWTSRYI